MNSTSSASSARPAPRGGVAFFADAHNLEALTPPLLRFRLVTPAPIAMGPGTLIRYRLNVHRVPVNWLTEITRVGPAASLRRRADRGPYVLWHHTHTFEALAGGGTLMRDVVRYRVGFGPLGALANRLLVRRDVEAIFDFREARIPALIAAA